MMMELFKFCVFELRGKITEKFTSYCKFYEVEVNLKGIKIKNWLIKKFDMFASAFTPAVDCPFA